MKKIITFEKNIDFPSMIGEITSISLDHSLKFLDQSNIEGNLTVAGTYKMTEASTIEEKFSYDLPVEVVLTEKLDLNDSTVSIDDFHYEIVNDDTLKCNIDILVKGVEEIIPEEEEMIRECDGDIKEDMELLDDNNINDVSVQEIEVEDINSNEEEKENNLEIEFNEEKEENQLADDTPTNISSLFESLSSADETFTTYSVYIYRKEDSLDKILDKYKITRDILSEYNDIDSIEIGSKIVIPNTNNE